MEMTAQQAIASIADMKRSLDERLPQIEKGLITERETRESFQKQLDDVLKAVEGIRQSSISTVNNPLDELEQRVLGQRGGLFSGKARMGYQRAMSLSVNHEMVRSKDKEAFAELKDLNDAVVMRYWQIRKQGNILDHGAILDEVAKSDDFKTYFVAMAKAGYVRADEVAHPASSGIGSNLNFTLLSSQLFDKVKLRLGLANEFIQLPLPRAQTNFPLQTGDAMGVLGGYAGTNPVKVPARDYADANAVLPGAHAFSNPTFSKIQFDCKHLLGFLLWNDDMFEDSVVPWLPIMRDQVSLAIARAWDTAVLNGCTGTHMDTDTEAGNDSQPQFAWLGLRKLGNTTKVTASGGVLTAALLRTNRANMGIHGLNPNELFHLIHIAGYYEILKDSNVLTVEKFGDAATIKTGVLAKLDGVDLKMHEAVRTGLNASGVQDGVTSTRTISLCVNRTRFINATFGQQKVEETRLAPQLSTVLQADIRADFKAIDADKVTANTNTEFAAGFAPVSVLYNVLT